MSREALALEISRIVSRVVSGEPVDTAERGAHLAAKYPEIGMSGEMIGQAIVRAAGMVGMIRTSPAPPMLSPAPLEPAAKPEPAPRMEAKEELRPPVIPTPDPKAAPMPRASSFDDELAAAIDAEIGVLVSGARHEAPADSIIGNGADEEYAAGDEQDPSDEPTPDERPSDGPRFVEEPDFSGEQSFTEEQAFAEKPAQGEQKRSPAKTAPPKGAIAALRRVFFRN